MSEDLTKTIIEKEYKKVLYYFFVEPFLNLKKFFCNLLCYFRTVYYAITNPKILFLKDELNVSKILSPAKGFIFIFKLTILFLIIYFFNFKPPDNIRDIDLPEFAEYFFIAIYLVSVLLIMLFCVIFDYFENYKMDKFDFVFKCLAYTFLTIYPFGILCSFNKFDKNGLIFIICLNLLFQIVFYYRIRGEISFNSAYKFRFIVISILFIAILTISGGGLNYHAIHPETPAATNTAPGADSLGKMEGTK